jgi:hypothetical protein
MDHDTLWAAYNRADALMKETNGHRFIHILKTRCDGCGLSEKAARGKCRDWFQTFLYKLEEVLRDES